MMDLWIGLGVVGLIVLAVIVAYWQGKRAQREIEATCERRGW